MEMYLFIAFSIFACITGSSVHTDEETTLDLNDKIQLKWKTNHLAQRITFTITAQTLGYIGFGISENGGMNGADIVIVGVYPNGFAYISDRFGVGNTMPVLDQKQDWELLSAYENGTHTIVKIARAFDTCDSMDFKIENGTSNLIWALGATDDFTYHDTFRGTTSVQLLDPVFPSIPEDDIQSWRINTKLIMPPNETTYWCTVVKAPKLDEKHHVVGFEPYLPTPASLEHSHHLIVRECNHPEGKDLSPILDPIVSRGGKYCYRESNTVVAQDGSQFCKAYLFVWAVGGKRTTFPEYAGFPFGGKDGSKYYMIEIHLNNPTHLTGVQIDTGLEIFYTSKLRKYDASALIVGHEVSLAQTLPPKAKDFISVGHCSEHCTAATLPEDGINVYNVLLHSHNAGSKVKLRHFRNGVELPWISYDNHYNFDYQQNRQLPSEVKILPGDQLSLECTYDTSKRTGFTIGGYSSQEEMCQAVLMYYPRIDLEMCSSTFPRDTILQDLQIDEIKSEPNVGDPIIIRPALRRGKRLTDILNELDWDDGKTEMLQDYLQYSYHRGVCSSRPSSNSTIANTRPYRWHIENVTYVPISEEYAPVISSICEQ